MSDLTGGPGAISRTSNGGNRGNGSSSAVPASQVPSGGIRTPRDIMEQRRMRDAAREARRKEEESGEAEQQQQISDEERRRSAERRAAAAGVATQQTRDSGYRSATTAGGRTPAEPAYATPTLSARAGGSGSRGRTGQDEFTSRDETQRTYDSTRLPTQVQRPPGVTNRIRESPQDQSRATSQQPTVQSSQAPYSQTKPTVATGPTTPSGRGTQSQPGAMSASGDGTRPKNSNVSSFPHAFERWETLSSRWEGLTSFWLTRLEQATEEVRRDPTSQQMSRQITDLSAAGANLFHAVVELQRLRASSERKFQRWWFETKAQQEESQENMGRLQQALDAERQARAADRESSQMSRQANRQVQESRRELQIAKDEARRAWEELGRREELERNQVLSLKDGLSISVGGIQVVPHGIPSRGDSLQRPSDQGAAYAGQSGAGPSRAGPGQQEYQSIPQDPSPTETDPFSGSVPRGQPEVRLGQVPSYTYDASQLGSIAQVGGSSRAQQIPTQSIAQPMAASVAQTSSAPDTRFYAQQESFLQPPSAGERSQRIPGQSAFSGSESEEEADYELDDQGNVRFDSAGRPMRYRSTGSRTRTGASGSVGASQPPVSQYRQEAGSENVSRERTRPQQYGAAPEQGTQVPSTLRPGMTTEPPPPAPMPGQTGEYGEAGEYEGAGYGDEEEDIEGAQAQQQHHHPTRLSDVPEEEDERSRASASRASRGSGSMF